MTLKVQQYGIEISYTTAESNRALTKLPGWIWDPLEEKWIEGYEQLKKYIDREGHAGVPHSFITSDGFRLGSWVKSQRAIYRRGNLTRNQIRALERIGFEWEKIE